MKTPTTRYPCCEHCVGEGCPRLSGHNIPCGHQGCASFISIMGTAQQLTPIDHAMEDIMSWRDDENIRGQKEELIDTATSILGQEPVGIRTMLKLLSHPGLIEQTRRYFEAMDASTKCLNYEAPWNCAREADAKYQTLQYGWIGAHPSLGVDDTWCEHCLEKMMGRPAIEEESEYAETQDASGGLAELESSDS